MTNGKSVAAWAKAQIGTPYKEIDCIKLVVLAVRNGEGASGESKTYQCGGCNELWRSLNASGKYRYVTKRLELETAKSLGLLRPGALLVIWKPGYNEKYDDNEGDCNHIGIYVGDDDCEVVHSSATRGCVAASTMLNGWTHVLIHRLIGLDAEDAEDIGYTPLDLPYEATVCTQKDPLTIREEPSVKARAIGKVKRGGKMTVVGVVQVDGDGRAWLPVEAHADNRRAIVRGWACSEYLAPDDEAGDDPAPLGTATVNIDCVIVPREMVLVLADAVNALRTTQECSAVDYMNDVAALLNAAEAITQHLKGDD